MEQQWHTKVKSVTSSELIIEYVEEFYGIEGPNWDKGIGIIDQYYSRYEGTIPPSSWPDSMKILTVNDRMQNFSKKMTGNK